MHNDSRLQKNDLLIVTWEDAKIIIMSGPILRSLQFVFTFGLVATRDNGLLPTSFCVIDEQFVRIKDNLF